MSLFSKRNTLVSIKVTRAPGDGHTEVILEVDGVAYSIDPGDFSKALATGATVIARLSVV